MKKFIIVLIFLLFSTHTVGAESISLAITPPKVEIITRTPSLIKIPIRLENKADTSISLRPALKPFKSSDKHNGNIILISTPSQLYQSLFSSILLEEGERTIQEFVLEPFEKKDLTLTIGLDSKQASRDYYFSLLFISKPVKNSSVTYSGISAGIGTNIILSVNPGNKMKARIDDFSTSRFTTHGPINFTVFIQNLSDHFIVPAGEIRITNMFGQEVGKLKLLPETILANSKRYMINTNTLEDTSQINSLDIPHLVWPETVLFGYYKAQLKLSLSEAGPVYTKETRFFALPLSVLAVIGFLVIVLGVFFRVIRKVK